MMAVGVARPRAQGQAITKTAIPAVRENLNVALKEKNQTRKVAMAIFESELLSLELPQLA
jgi:hypothetical protein